MVNSIYIFYFTIVAFILLFTFNKKFRRIFYYNPSFELKRLSESEFYDQFESKFPQELNKKRECWKELIDMAWKIRDFEIDTYWKRANYFWLFEAAVFTVYFVNYRVSHSSLSEMPDEIFVVICAGMLFSTAWLLINKGGKAWQSHWENIIHLLEIKYYGPYSYVLSYKTNYSVSKINEIVIFLFFTVWFLFAMQYCIVSDLTFTVTPEKFNPIISFTMLFTILSFISMLFGYGRAHYEDKVYKMYKLRFIYTDN